MAKLDLTLLNTEQICGSSRLEILKRYGISAMGTDLITLLGGYLNEKSHVSVPSIANTCGSYWLSPFVYDNGERYSLYSISPEGNLDLPIETNCKLMIRPVLHLPLEELKKLKIEKNDWDITYTYFLEYPQFVVDKEKNDLLEEKYQQGDLVSTGKEYTFNEYFQCGYFNLSKCPEYFYDKEKYVRVWILANGGCELSRGEKLECGKPYFVKVSPIKWLYDEPTGLLISERGLVSGVRFDMGPMFESVEDSELSQYISNYLAYEMIPSETKSSSVILDGDEELQKVMFKRLQSKRRM